MKSSSKKSTSSSHPSGKGSRDTKPMPSLVFNEVRFDARDAETDTESREDLPLIRESLRERNSPSALLPTNNPPPPQGAWGYIWLSVGIVMAVVIGVWAYSLPGRLNVSSWRDSGEYKLLQQAQNHWGTTFSSTTDLLSGIDTSPLTQAIATLTDSTTPSSSPTSSTTTLPILSSSTTIASSSISASSTKNSTTTNK